MKFLLAVTLVGVSVGVVVWQLISQLKSFALLVLRASLTRVKFSGASPTCVKFHQRVRSAKFGRLQCIWYEMYVLMLCTALHRPIATRCLVVLQIDLCFRCSHKFQI